MGKRIKILSMPVSSLLDMALGRVESDDIPADSKLIAHGVHLSDLRIINLKIESASFEETAEGGAFPVFHPVFKEKP